jgi:hypothetical protein
MTLISSPENSRLKYMNIVEQYTLLIHTIISYYQNTVEISTYDSELVASRIAMGLILEIRFMLRSLGVALDRPALIIAYNMSVVLNTPFTFSLLKKKYDTITYHIERSYCIKDNEVCIH